MLSGANRCAPSSPSKQVQMQLQPPTILRAFLQERLADWKMPDSIYFERELPLGRTGKVNRRLLREAALELSMSRTR
jgi:acyl-CoA synthetase (AMP-forming)/AMP-acid ligase II